MPLTLSIGGIRLSTFTHYQAEDNLLSPSSMELLSKQIAPSNLAGIIASETPQANDATVLQFNNTNVITVIIISKLIWTRKILAAVVHESYGHVCS